jgi:putative peptidoglycan lipid II flippase
VLARRGDFRLDRRGRRSLPRIAAAAAGMGAVLLLLRAAFGVVLAGPPLLRIAALGGFIAVGLVSFVLFALVLGVTEWRELWGRLRRQPA